MRNSKELEDIFIDEIVGRVKNIKGLNPRSPHYKENVNTSCDIILDYIDRSQHLIKQKDNYESLLLERMLADGMITEDVFNHYNSL